MPFQSEKQRRYLWANEPEIARDWTDTYGSRISRDNGGIMDMASDGNLNHEFENYIDNGNVSVPKSFQARSHSTPVNLAYITDKEAGILQALKPGTPHRGPLEIPNYDDYDPTGGGYGRATSGQQMSAMETGGGQTEQNRVDARALGYTPQQVTDIRGGAQAAAAMGQRGRGSGFNFNPLSIIGGAFGNVGRGIGFLLGQGKGFAGKMRGGINPETGKYYTQAEFEQNRQNRRNQASIDRILRTRDTKYANDPAGWEKSPLKARLAGFQDLTGYTGESAQGKNELELYTDRTTPGDPGERIGEYWRDDQGIKPPASEYEGMWDNRGITGAIPSRNPIGGVDQFAKEVLGLEQSAYPIGGTKYRVDELPGTLQDYYQNKVGYNPWEQMRVTQPLHQPNEITEQEDLSKGWESADIRMPMSGLVNYEQFKENIADWPELGLKEQFEKEGLTTPKQQEQFFDVFEKALREKSKGLKKQTPTISTEDIQKAMDAGLIMRS